MWAASSGVTHLAFLPMTMPSSHSWLTRIVLGWQLDDPLGMIERCQRLVPEHRHVGPRRAVGKRHLEPSDRMTRSASAGSAPGVSRLRAAPEEAARDENPKFAGQAAGCWCRPTVRSGPHPDARSAHIWPRSFLLKFIVTPAEAGVHVFSYYFSRRHFSPALAKAGFAAGIDDKKRWAAHIRRIQSASRKSCAFASLSK